MISRSNETDTYRNITKQQRLMIIYALYQKTVHPVLVLSSSNAVYTVANSNF